MTKHRCVEVAGEVAGLADREGRGSAIDRDYRGPVPVRLARLLGGDVTRARLAAASRTGDHDPQAIKWLWHCLARFGRQN